MSVNRLEYIDGDMVDDVDGPYVLYSDYAALESELSALKAKMHPVEGEACQFIVDPFNQNSCGKWGCTFYEGMGYYCDKHVPQTLAPQQGE